MPKAFLVHHPQRNEVLTETSNLGEASARYRRGCQHARLGCRNRKDAGKLGDPLDDSTAALLTPASASGAKRELFIEKGGTVPRQLPLNINRNIHKGRLRTCRAHHSPRRDACTGASRVINCWFCLFSVLMMMLSVPPVHQLCGT